ncbi:hypothetical protein RI129_007486 [Pyrocoelia pectoralis]|uniref:Uncharacterized protein n=1 Tax=Pyrocoelia pectoralis TaxID=417401 RepID=A0AAN7ZMM7_9COLE
MDTSRSTVTKPINSKRKSTANNPKTILFRKYTAKGTTCLESAINDLVARVRLDRLDYSDFLANKMKYAQPVPSRKPQKRKLIHQMNANLKRIRMNHNITENSNKIRMSMNSMKTKPFKSNSVTSHLNTDTNKHHFNGDKRQIAISSPRVRKPNPKFQDFITSSQIRFNSPAADKQVKEKADVSAAKPKSKLLKTAISIPEKDPLELMNSNSTEPTGDDVVRSFLPVIDIPKVLYDSDSSAETDEDPMMNNSKANQSPSHALPQNQEETEKILNTQSVTPSPSKLNKVDPSQLMPPTQLTTNTSIILAPHTVTPVLISPQVPLIIATNFGPGFKSISTPITKDVSGTDIKSVVNNGTQKKQSIQLPKSPLRTYADKKIIKKNIPLEELKQPAKVPLKTYTEKKSVKKNITPEVIKKKDTSRYYLVESEGVSNRTKTSKTNSVDFNKLVRTLKSVKLPAANWKIRIVVSRSQTITEVTFTNKEVNERCVKFSRFFTGYVLTFGKSVVQLIGAPNKITSYEDVTTLLDIVHNLALSDPVLQYVGDKDK